MGGGGLHNPPEDLQGESAARVERYRACGVGGAVGGPRICACLRGDYEDELQLELAPRIATAKHRRARSSSGASRQLQPHYVLRIMFKIQKNYNLYLAYADDMLLLLQPKIPVGFMPTI